MNGGGIGKQVVSELGEIAKDAVKETIKLGTGIVEGSGDQSQRRAISAPERQKSLQRVRDELAAYINKKKQEEKQTGKAEERDTEIKKEEEKEKTENEREAIINQARRSGGGTGEVARKKY